MSQQGGWGNKAHKINSCWLRWEKKARRGEKGVRGRALEESGLVLVISGAITCHPDHLVLDRIVDTFLSGNRS